MDNEVLVDKIVRSLSFEVVAIPQDKVRQESTSKATLLNVKIKVRTNNDAGLRHGVLSMPKVDHKEDKIPKRIRLVSSDKTIMSFNVEMEAVYDKIPQKSGTSTDKEKGHHTSLSKNVDKYKTSQFFLKSNKDIFGRCKPGGCLDPPFGEEKYAYEPTPIHDIVTAKDNTTKLRSSSTFKNKIFNRKRKSTLTDEVNKEHTFTKTNADSILSLYEHGSKSPTHYSNSLITYPHPSSSSELRLQEDKSSKKRYFYEVKSKLSVVEDSNYFIMSKNAKNRISKCDENQIEHLDIHADESVEETDKNELQTTSSSDNITMKPLQMEKEKLNNTSKIPYTIPIPLSATSQDDKNITYDITNEIAQKDSPETEETKSLGVLEMADDLTDTDNINNECKIFQTLKCEDFPDRISENNAPLPDVNKMDVSRTATGFSGAVAREVKNESLVNTPIFDDENTTIKEVVANSRLVAKLENSEFSKYIIESTILHKIQNVDDDINDINQTRSSTHQNVIPIVDDVVKKVTDENINIDNYTDDHETRLSINTDSRIEFKSQLLVPEARDKSLLDVTAVFPPTETDCVVHKLSKTQQSMGNLTQIWENEVEPLKSVADVLVHNKLPQEDFVENNVDTYVGQQTFLDLPKVNINEENFKSLTISDSGPVKNASTLTSKNKKEFIDNTESNKNILKLQKSRDDDNIEGIFLVNQKDDIGFVSGTMTEKISKHLQTNDTNRFDMKRDLSEKSNKIDLIHPADPADYSALYSQDYFKGQTIDQTPSALIKLEAEVVSGRTTEVTTGHKDIDGDMKPQFESSQVPVEGISLKKPEPSSILRKDAGYWRMDLALQSYIGENNERVIKSFDSENVIDRGKNETLLVAQCFMNTKANEIEIPIDHENDLHIKIKENRRQNQIMTNTNEMSAQTDEYHKSKKIKIDIADTDKDNKDVTLSQSKEYVEVNSAIRDALKTIYEQELVPLQETIKALREEIDMLAAYETNFREKVHKLTPKRSRPLRLISGNKKCACVRRV